MDIGFVLTGMALAFFIIGFDMIVFASHKKTAVSGYRLVYWSLFALGLGICLQIILELQF